MASPSSSPTGTSHPSTAGTEPFPGGTVRPEGVPCLARAKPISQSLTNLVSPGFIALLPYDIPMLSGPLKHSLLFAFTTAWCLLLLGVLAVWISSYWVSTLANRISYTTTYIVGPPGQKSMSGYGIGFNCGMGHITFSITDISGHVTNQPVTHNTTDSDSWNEWVNHSPEYPFDLPHNTYLRRVGFGYEIKAINIGPSGAHIPMTTRILGIPLWALALCMALVAGVLVHHSVKVHREVKAARRSLCRKCAYDLRGTQFPSCPECGAPRP
jgi:hypothetical protein